MSLKIKHLALNYKAKQTSGSSLSQVFVVVKIPPLHQHLGDLLAEAGPLGPVSFLVRMGGTFLGRNKNNTAQHILISNCQTYIRESGLGIARLPRGAIETIRILCEYLSVGRHFGDWGRGAEKRLMDGCSLDSGLKT